MQGKEENSMRQVWNIIKYMIIFCANLLMLFFLHGYFNLIIMIIMIIMPIASILTARLMLSRLHVSFAGAKENIHIEDPFVLKVVLDNPAWIPMLNVNLKLHVKNAFFRLEGEHVLNIPAYAGQRNEISYPLSSEYLGVLSIEAEQMQVLDWLGFVCWKRDISEKKEIVLLPFGSLEVEPDMAAVNNGMTELEESRKKGHDFSDVQDVREYRPGDKLQNIHWKLSAKKDALMVKERVSLSSSQLIVLVELFQNETMILNRILIAAYGMAHFLLQNQIPFTLQWWSTREEDMKRMPVDNQQDLDAWIESIYYEAYYETAELGCMMMRRLVQEDTRFMVIGSSGMTGGDVLLQYGGDVEGYICN